MVSVTFNSDQWQTGFCNWDRWYVKQLRIQPNAAWDRSHTHLPGTCFCCQFLGLLRMVPRHSISVTTGSACGPTSCHFRHKWVSVWSHFMPFTSEVGQHVVHGPLHAVSITTRSACGPTSCRFRHNWVSMWSHFMPFPAQLDQRVVPLHAVSGTTGTTGSACGPTFCRFWHNWVRLWSHFMPFPAQLGQHVVPLHAVSDTTGLACGPTSCRFRHKWVSMWSHFMPFPTQLGQHVVPLHAVSGTTGSGCGPTSCRFRHNWVSVGSGRCRRSPVSQTVLGHDELTFISAISLWKQYSRPSGVVVRVTLTVLSSSAAGNGVRGAECAEWVLFSCRVTV